MENDWSLLQIKARREALKLYRPDWSLIAVWDRDRYIMVTGHEIDKMFLHAAPTDIDWLLAEVERLTAENTALSKENAALVEGLDEFVRHQR